MYTFHCRQRITLEEKKSSNEMMSRIDKIIISIVRQENASKGNNIYDSKRKLANTLRDKSVAHRWSRFSISHPTR
jgi:hypothetical protein